MAARLPPAEAAEGKLFTECEREKKQSAESKRVHSSLQRNTKGGLRGDCFVPPLSIRALDTALPRAPCGPTLNQLINVRGMVQ